MSINKDARYYRLYYLMQGILARDIKYRNSLAHTADGGVRSQSTLPPELNKKAHELTIEALTDIKDSKWIVTSLQFGLVGGFEYHKDAFEIYDELSDKIKAVYKLEDGILSTINLSGSHFNCIDGSAFSEAHTLKYNLFEELKCW